MFLNRALGQSPEDDLLLPVQGMIAEYERAKIINAIGVASGMQRAGAVNVLSGAPYGYRYVSKYEGVDRRAMTSDLRTAPSGPPGVD